MFGDAARHPLAPTGVFTGTKAGVGAGLAAVLKAPPVAHLREDGRNLLCSKHLPRIQNFLRRVTA